MEIAYNENLDFCKECGGRCCCRMGCHTHPDDIIKRFGPITRETLIKALLCGDYSADCWEGDVRHDNNIPFDENDFRSQCWYIRARHIGAEAVDQSYGGICANLTKHGCKFSWDDRPSGGKALIPQKGGGCGETTFDKVPAIIEWLPYSDLIDDIVSSEEFDKHWTDPMKFTFMVMELHDQGKKVEDLIPD